MIDNQSALEALKAHRIEIDNLIFDLEDNHVCRSRDIKLDLLLVARERLAVTRALEKFKT